MVTHEHSHKETRDAYNELASHVIFFVLIRMYQILISVIINID